MRQDGETLIGNGILEPQEVFMEALSSVRAGRFGKHQTPSQTNYVIDPTDDTLWDLKPVLGLTLEKLEGGRVCGDTDSLANRCRESGVFFERVMFSKRKARPLGLRAGEELDPVDWSELDHGNGTETEADTANPSFYFVKRYNRNPIVVTEALDRAKGVCQACDKKAPFKSLKGEPFLEVHHIIPLSSGGPDTPSNVVALCPNCHRKQHVGEPDDFTIARR